MKEDEMKTKILILLSILLLIAGCQGGPSGKSAPTISSADGSGDGFLKRDQHRHPGHSAVQPDSDAADSAAYHLDPDHRNCDAAPNDSNRFLCSASSKSLRSNGVCH